MRFYSLNDEHVLHLPLKRFWLLHKNVDRISAEEDLRAIQIGIAVQSGDGYKQTVSVLRKQMGRVVQYDEAKRSLTEKRDREGLKRLKSMGTVGRR